jgi:hypothetical protein
MAFDGHKKSSKDIKKRKSLPNKGKKLMTGD